MCPDHPPAHLSGPVPHLPSLDMAPPPFSLLVWDQVRGELLGMFAGGRHRQPALCRSTWPCGSGDLVAQPRWLIEGNYAATLPIRLAAADTVIFPDLHAITCLAGIARRRRYRVGQHAKDGVYDHITWNFVPLYLGIPQEHAPQGPSALGRARWQRPVGHADQPSACA
jgi:hypothetical protein